MGREGSLQHWLAGYPCVVAADAVEFPAKAGAVEGIQRHLDRGEVEVVAADGQVLTLAI